MPGKQRCAGTVFCVFIFIFNPRQMCGLDSCSISLFRQSVLGRALFSRLHICLNAIPAVDFAPSTPYKFTDHRIPVMKILGPPGRDLLVTSLGYILRSGTDDLSVIKKLDFTKQCLDALSTFGQGH